MQLLEKYNFNISESETARAIIDAKELAREFFTSEHLKNVFSVIDLTTLNVTDNKETAKILAQKINKFPTEYPGIPDVATMCVFPPLVKTAATYLKIKTVGLASVGAGFPTSQTFLNVKKLECEEIAQRGATDVDIVISLGDWVAGNYEKVFTEIEEINKAIGYSHLKVILETGILKEYKDIWNASLVALEAGTEFVKTSTGKTKEPAATPEAFYVMCRAVKEYHKQTGRMAGVKAAGGITTSNEALVYYAIVKQVLGDEWLSKKHFRIGASKLANNLLSDIIKLDTGRNEIVNYF